MSKLPALVWCAALSANRTSWNIGEVQTPEICGIFGPKLRRDIDYRSRKHAFQLRIVVRCSGICSSLLHYYSSCSFDGRLCDVRSTSPLRHAVALDGLVMIVGCRGFAESERWCNCTDDETSALTQRGWIEENSPGSRIKEFIAASRGRLEAMELVQDQ
jgi:hypothetical protein